MPSARTRPAMTSEPGFRASPTAVTSEIDLTGTSRIAAVASAQWLDSVRAYVDTLPGDVHEVMLEGPAAGELSFFQQLASDPDLLALLESVTRQAHPKAGGTQPTIECALRVINGAQTADHPLWFHYDASVVTVVLPIDVPDAGSGQSGELVLYPNHRPYRRWALTNVVEKAVVQTDAYRRRFIRRPNWDRDAELVSLQPGDAYLFWGYRSYHATMPVPAGTRRVTAILHYRDVHAQSRILKHAKAFYHRVWHISKP